MWSLLAYTSEGVILFPEIACEPGTVSVPKLPIDAILPQILASLRSTPNLVIEAPPGAGKTTRVPPALMDLIPNQILVLEPRRIAARLAARRVASELGVGVGETVGYQVRFEDVSSPRTRIRFVTEGVFTRRLLSDPDLNNIGAVILDEFHERHLETDLALTMLRRLQASARPGLKLVVMSATLQTAPVAAYLHNCPVLRSEGRLFDLEVTHLPYSAEPLENQVANSLEQLVKSKPDGDVLVFLPGAAEIRRAARACEASAKRYDLLVLPLHGDLSPAEQDRAVTPAVQRKVILSTNIAESSITIEGVTAVIDSGLARVATDSPWTGLPTLQVSRISKASATQRAGRAARTAPGRAIRLYSGEDLHRRPDHDTPEILRRELSQLCLDLRVMGVNNPLELEWLDAPPESSVAVAESLLELLGADGPFACRMAELPLHPRIARLVLESVNRGVGEDGCAVAALLSSGARTSSPELIEALDSDWDPRTRQHYDQIRRLVRPPRQVRRDLDPLLISILAGFPDRVGRRRRDNQVLLSNGKAAALADPSHTSEFFVAVDIEDRSENALPLIRLTSAVQPEWLLDLFPSRVHERNTVDWNRTAERVEAVNAIIYDQLVIDETRSGSPNPEQAAELLAKQAAEAGIERFVDQVELAQLIGRIEFASAHAVMSKPDIQAALRDLCFGLKSFSELKAAAASGLLWQMEQQANPQLLNSIAPSRIRLPSGRQAKVHYDANKPPWVASRLQDFFGMQETPKVANGNVPLVVHLLAPNQRAVQTTTDLAGFWQRLYPQIRKELSRRYPKHAWPENPNTVVERSR
jgi:ATP-dependent helicase HrpB